MVTCEKLLREAIVKLEDMPQTADNNELLGLIESALFENENLVNELKILENDYNNLRYNR
jgi:HEPN domain-containing protein